MWGRGPNDLPPEDRRRTTEAIRLFLIVAVVATVGAIVASSFGASTMQVFVGVLIFLAIFGILGWRIPAIQEMRQRTRAANDAQDPRQRIGQLIRLMIVTLIVLGVTAALSHGFLWFAVALAILSIVSTWYEVARAKRRL